MSHSNLRPPFGRLYPEGMCTNGKVLVQFKKGAFTSGKVVQPIVMKYNSTYLNVSANGDMNNMAFGFIMMMLQPYNHLNITLLERHIPTEEEKKDSILYANNVRMEMAEFMNVTATEHSYEDVFFLTHLRKTNTFGFIKQNFAITDLKKQYDLSFDDIKLFLEKFAVLTSSSNATGLTYIDFCTCLNLTQNSKYSFLLFQFFDTNDDAEIEFVEFVRGISLLSGRVNDVEQLKLAFVMLEKGGTVALSDLKSYLSDALRMNKVRAALKVGTKNSESGEVAETTVKVDHQNDENWTPSTEGSMTLRQSSLDSCFDAIDEDADGRVTFDEFVLLANERGTLVGPLMELAQSIVQELDVNVEVETKDD